MIERPTLYVHVDWGLWIRHSDLEQPSQISDSGKNVKLSINGPNCGRGQCSQSTMDTGTGWTPRISTTTR